MRIWDPSVWSLVVCLAASGCTVQREVPVGSARAAGAFQPDARLAVTLRDGTQVRQRYVGSDAESLVVGETYRVTRGLDRENDPDDKRVVPTRIAWQDIGRIELVEVSAWRTALLILVPAALLAASVQSVAVIPP